MTSSNAGTPRPIDARQIDALDRYIDGLAQGIDRPAADLAPRLVAAVRTIHAADASAANIDPDRSDEDRLWRDLMQLRPRPELRALPRSGSATVLPPLTGGSDGPPSALRPMILRSPGRLRHVGDRTLGLVATLTLVALVTLSGLAVYLSAPDRSAPPTSIAGVGATTPDARPLVAVAATPGVIGDAGPVPADAIRPIVQDCTVVPRTMEDAITTLARPYTEQVVGSDPDSATGIDAYANRPYLIPNAPGSSGGQGPLVEPLPSGMPVDPATVDAIALLYGQSIGCSWEVRNNRLAEYGLLSDDGLIRLIWRGKLGPSGPELVSLGLAPEPVSIESGYLLDPNDPTDHTGTSPEYLSQIGQPSRVWLWGFRLLEDGRVAAYIANSSGRAADSYPVTFEEMSNGQLANGYIVFVQQDGQWLIDEERGPMLG